jgi:hypothetical protein
MDNRTLKIKENLSAFLSKCEELGRPVQIVKFEQAFPGFADSSYLIWMDCPWTNQDDSFDARTFLIDTYFATTPYEKKDGVLGFFIKQLDEPPQRIMA